MAWEPAETAPRLLPAYRCEALLVWIPLAMLLMLGFWIPHPLRTILEQASSILGALP